MSRYVALLDGHAGAYGVVVPDLPGCSSGGATIEEAVANTQEAVIARSAPGATHDG